MSDARFNVIEGEKVHIKAWTRGVPVEDAAVQQLKNLATLPFVYHHVAAMPDVHFGKGSTIGSVFATKGAVIPAAVGVDIGCGMMAIKTSLNASRLPDNLHPLRTAIEEAVPVGRTNNGQAGDRGAWGDIPHYVGNLWATELLSGFQYIAEKYPRIASGNSVNHLGTLGTGNHFIEVCLDEANDVWIMLHSGSRGVGNRIGSHFIELAKKDMERHFISLPDKDLSYLVEGSEHYNDYCKAVSWAQGFAKTNRDVMMRHIIQAMRSVLPEFTADQMVVNCHHNYVSHERHFGENVLLTRKGAVRAGLGDMGIIPGSMGAKSFIVRGKGNRDSFESCSHGAGRAMSRTEAKKRFTIADHEADTAGVECRKDAEVIDETPKAYKDIDAVMAAQSDLVDVVHTLKQVVCVKG